MGTKFLYNMLFYSKTLRFGYGLQHLSGIHHVLRIDRRGRDWIVTTSLGVITSDAGLY